MPEVPGVPDSGDAGLRAANARLRELLAGRDERIAERDAEVVLLREALAGLQSQVADLAARVKSNSRDSSKPPSSDGLARPEPKSLRGKSGRKPGRPEGQPGATMQLSEHPGPFGALRLRPAARRACLRSSPASPSTTRGSRMTPPATSRELAAVTGTGTDLGRARAQQAIDALLALDKAAGAARQDGKTAIGPEILKEHADWYRKAAVAGTALNAGRNGKLQEKRHALATRMRARGDGCLRFARGLRVPFPDSAAEQAIRMSRPRHQRARPPRPAWPSLAMTESNTYAFHHGKS